MLQSISPILSSALRFGFHLSCPVFYQAKTRLHDCLIFFPTGVFKIHGRMKSTLGYKNCSMDAESLSSFNRKRASIRTCLVTGFLTELLEIESEEPYLNILFIPGNPGIVSFYKDFVEGLYEKLEGKASITVIGHISHSNKDFAFGRLFSLQEQINHKAGFIKGLQNKNLPIILVGHSIGSYVCMDVLKSFPEQVIFSIFLYPFLTLNTSSFKQYMIGVLARSSLLSATISYFGALLGSFPTPISRALLSTLVGPSWSRTAFDAASSLMKYHTARNVLFMAKTEFEKLSEEPEWRFIEANKKQIAFLFGLDDHWGPLSLFEELSRRVPGVAMSIEREGHTHGFCCTESGSIWVAHHVANLISNQVRIRNEASKSNGGDGNSSDDIVKPTDVLHAFNY